MTELQPTYKAAVADVVTTMADPNLEGASDAHKIKAFIPLIRRHPDHAAGIRKVQQTLTEQGFKPGFDVFVLTVQQGLSRKITPRSI